MAGSAVRDTNGAIFFDLGRRIFAEFSAPSWMEPDHRKAHCLSSR